MFPSYNFLKWKASCTTYVLIRKQAARCILSRQPKIIWIVFKSIVGGRSTAIWHVIGWISGNSNQSNIGTRWRFITSYSTFMDIYPFNTGGGRYRSPKIENTGTFVCAGYVALDWVQMASWIENTSIQWSIIPPRRGGTCAHTRDDKHNSTQTYSIPRGRWCVDGSFDGSRPLLIQMRCIQRRRAE